MSCNRISLRELFLSFLRLGAAAFGGPAMVVYIRRMAVEQKRWLDDDTIKTGVSLCQTIPGATAMQMSAYVGLMTRGVRGAAVSFLGFGLPAFVLMTVLAFLYIRFASLPAAVSIFSGLHALIVAIIANATLSFGRTTFNSWRSLIVAAWAAVAFLLHLNPIIVIASSAILGMWLMTSMGASSSHATTVMSMRGVKPAIIILVFVILLMTVLLFLDKRLFELAALMLRIDIFAFGGGFASVPLMYHEIVDVRAWLSAAVFIDGIALGQITPGPIVITATFIGFMIGGLAGAIAATAGIFVPSFLMVIIAAPYFDRLRSSPRFVRALEGILCSFVGLLLAVTIHFATEVYWAPSHVVLAAAALIALLCKVDILWVVFAGVVYSAFLC